MIAGSVSSPGFGFHGPMLQRQMLARLPGSNRMAAGCEGERTLKHTPRRACGSGENGKPSIEDIADARSSENGPQV